MLPANVKQFTTYNHRGVLTCFRKNGMPQVSIVTCGAVSYTHLRAHET